jgi:tetratricopeptide (TPR) repeat protein
MTSHAVVELEAGVEVRRLMNELLGVEAQRREEMVHEERFRSLALAELLVAEGGRFEEASPAKVEELAGLAERIADMPYPGSLMPEADRILVRSYCLQANARRMSGDRGGAEDNFEKAAMVLLGPAGAAERGFYCQRLAWLREEQGHVDEAVALLWHAVDRFRQARDADARGACLCRLGFLALRENDLEGASQLFAEGRGLLSAARTPVLAARCGLGLALCLAARGQEERARGLRQESRLHGDVVPDPRNLLELDWLEGRLAVLLGEHQEAVGRLNSVRRRLFVQRRLLDAGLCSLDLARVFMALDQEPRIGELIADLNRIFPVSFERVRIAVALEDYRKEARAGRDLEKAARESMDLMRRTMAILKKL